MGKKSSLVPVDRIKESIRIVRGQRVMLDYDLATFYGVTTGNLVKAVKRNIDRFPSDFMFQLTRQEFTGLLFQNGTSKGRGGRRKPPYAFTEYGVAMLSSVLRSKRAVQVNIEIMRTFVLMRRAVAADADLAKRVQAMGARLDLHDKAIAILFDEIEKLLSEPEPVPKGSIGFKPGNKG